MKQQDINPAWEAEIKKALDAIWENRNKVTIKRLNKLKTLIK